MKHLNLKHIIALAIVAIAVVTVAIAQVNINAPKGLNQGTRQEPEKKAESTESGNETAKNENAGNAGENATPTANTPSQPRNNTAVNAPNNNQNTPNNNKPVTLNQDYSTGNNSTNLQSRQQIEMRSYGYRILVYHTNKSKNAKANAQKRAKDITVKFPQYQFYFNYKAPTWRLRVGDFADEESAHRALKQLKQAFPMYSKEMTIIHDHINVWK